MSNPRSGASREYSKDLFGSVYQKNGDIFNSDGAPQSRFGQLKVRADFGDKSSDDIGNTSGTYSPLRRTPSHKQSYDLSFESGNLSLATINERTKATQLGQQQPQPLWFNNPKRRTIPSQVIRRENFDEADSDSSFLAKSKDNNDASSGFKTLTFGTKRNNDPELAHVNAFSDELPPTRTISDLQKEESSEAYLSFNNDNLNNGNFSVLSAKPIGEDSSLTNNGTPNFQHTKNVLPDNLFNSPLQKNVFSTPSKVSAFQQPQQAPQQTNSPQLGGESAVLVFGYPESIANTVIKHFAKFGNILEDFESTRTDPLFHKPQKKNYPIFTGNGWVKLTYDNKASAIRALEENGTVFHGAIIGCVPYSKGAIESIASISVKSSEDIGESDIAPHHANDEDKDTTSYPNRFKQKITLKNDDSIFVKSRDPKQPLYTSKTEGKPTAKSSILGKVNNWLFGWDNL